METPIILPIIVHDITLLNQILVDMREAMKDLTTRVEELEAVVDPIVDMREAMKDLTTRVEELEVPVVNERMFQCAKCKKKTDCSRRVVQPATFFDLERWFCSAECKEAARGDNSLPTRVPPETLF